MMYWFNAVMVGLKEIFANKFRSLLTMLGIILGVSSLVAMSALVKGMENGMKEALVAIGGLEKQHVEEHDILRYQQHLAAHRLGTPLDRLSSTNPRPAHIPDDVPLLPPRHITMTHQRTHT